MQNQSNVWPTDEHSEDFLLPSPEGKAAPGRRGHCPCSKHKIPCTKQVVEYDMECLNSQGVGSTAAKFHYRYGLKASLIHTSKLSEMPLSHSNPSLPFSLPTSKLPLTYKYKTSVSHSVFVFITLSLSDLKSAICTLILRSRRAIRPASEQIALISAPERSSF